MKIDVDELSSIQKKIRVELPMETVNQEFSRVYESLGQRAKVKGFRPGKVPRSVLQGLYGDEVRGEVLSRLVQDSLNTAFKERGLDVVSRPEVEADELEENRAFTFSAIVEVKPEIEVKDYLGLELEKVKLSVENAQVEAALRHLQEVHAHLEPVEERDVVQEGDYIILDFVGSVDGKPFPGGKGENYALEVGGGRALPQFEQALVGLKKEGEDTISVAYPEDHFNRELAGKVVMFSVTVRDIKKKILPPLDDGFAKDYGECGSLVELKEKIRARLEDELREIQSKELKEQLLGRLIEAYPFEVPRAMLDRHLHYLMERHRMRRAGQGSTSSGEPTTEQVRKELEPQARRQVQATLLIDKIAALEKIEVSDKEIQEKIEELSRSAGKEAVTLRDFYRRSEAREDLRSQMVFEKTTDFLLQGARVKELAPAIDAQEKKR
jgi:trigger factor